MDILIDKENAGKNIRTLLRGDMGYSSGMLKKLKFSHGGILVNGEFQTVRYELSEGDVLSIACEDTDSDVSPYIIPFDLDIGIAYEDTHLTVVDKPHNMPAHPSFGHRDDTVANALAYRYSGEPYVFRPVNRLDRDTSGLMICARTRPAAFKLYKSMVNSDIKKVYIAVLSGKPENSQGIIRTYVSRCEDSIVKRRICSEKEDGAKEAVTVYKTLFCKAKYTVVAASPLTGRTHQLRLHFAHIGCPIAGDTMYGDPSPEIERHALHAAALRFPHPESGEILTVTSPIPRDMMKLTGDSELKIESLFDYLGL